jgi:hypothetical protein
MLAAAAAALVEAPAARAQAVPVPAGIPDLIGARGLSLGAYRGLAAGNDGIFTNVASLAARRRYSIETQWLLDRDGADNALQAYTVSAVDSETGAATGGFAYTRVLSGPWVGSLFHVPIAFPVSDGLFLGVTPKYQSLDGPFADRMRAANVDAAAFWQATSLIALGFSGYNLLDSGHRQIQPRAVGAGVSIGDERRFHVAADWRGDLQRKGKLSNLFAVGGEVLVGDYVPLRASYVRDETRNANFWSTGLGIVTAQGFAIDLGYRQGIDDPHDRTFAAALKLFLMSR